MEPQDSNPGRIDRFKAHFERNRNRYWVGSLVGVAGITYLIMRSTVAHRGAGVGLNAHRGLANTASFIFGKNEQTITVVKVVRRHGPGHPGYPVMNLETGLTTTSARAMAKTFDISEGNLLGHLNGRFPDVKGLHFAWADLSVDAKPQQKHAL